jgi:hypothetical protein
METQGHERILGVSHNPCRTLAVHSIGLKIDKSGQTRMTLCVLATP